MKKTLIFIILGIVLLSSCATGNYNLNKTIWYNQSLAENEGVKGTVVTSLYFVSESNVDIYSSVMVDTNLVVTPFKIAKGTYSTSGNPKKEAKISIAVETLHKETVKYNGEFHKDKAMILVSQDSVAKLYGKLLNTKLP
jgi:hypothetical protein